MKTNPTSFVEDYFSPEITMIALDGGNVLIVGSNQLLESGSSEDLDDEYIYSY